MKLSVILAINLMKSTNAHKMMNQSYDFLDLFPDPIRTPKLSVIGQKQY